MLRTCYASSSGEHSIESLVTNSELGGGSLFEAVMSMQICPLCFERFYIRSEVLASRLKLK